MSRPRGGRVRRGTTAGPQPSPGKRNPGAAVVPVVRALVEAGAPLPGPDDRPVPGTHLVVAYRPGITFLPGIEEVPILALLRSPRL